MIEAYDLEKDKDSKILSKIRIKDTKNFGVDFQVKSIISFFTLINLLSEKKH